MSVFRIAIVMLPGFMISALAAAGGYERAFQNDTMTVSKGGKPLFVYRLDNVPFKPYVQQLYSPNGVNVLRDAPSDHLHHHALMFAIAVDDVDFWAETPECGKQIFAGDVENDDPGKYTGYSACYDARLKWMNGEQKVLLDERRTLWPLNLDGVNATAILWRSKLSVPEGTESAKLTGHHYFGLGMRFVESMDRVVTFMNSEGAAGEIVRGEERNTPARWCACTGPIDGKPVTVAMFDAPTNPRHPAVWFTMPVSFAYMSATLNLYKEPMTLSKDAPLDLKYGVLVWDGAVSKEDIESAYQIWLKALER
ncbi:MAG: PmoA family protein [Candidatus Hydrogenedentes bacterium]|nr:PmoA family protein [Candidatus Hydrogenedentota bacterium]